MDPVDRAGSETQIELADEVEQVELGPGKFTNMGKAMQGNAKQALITFLKDNQAMFAWTATDMPGIP